MFSDTDSLPSAPMTPDQVMPKSEPPATLPTNTAPITERPLAAPRIEPHEGSRRRVGWGTKMRLIILAIVASVFLILLLFLYLPKGIGNNDSGNEDTNINNITTVVDPIRPDESSAGAEFTILDSDGDGLTDEREAEVGTKINQVDSDGDGLSDREEVEIYKTDPLDRDTDNDSFSDGEEVRNFFNPNGEGQLIDVKAEIEKFEEGTEEKN